MTTPLAAWQRRILAAGWLTYAGYYLGRVNISTAIPGLREELGFSAQEAGLLTSGFFLCYGLGQLLSGYLGDRASPRLLVLAGMTASAALNLAFGTLSSWGLLLLVWTVNGFFQASGWAPILRLLANWYDTQARRRISGLVASSFVAGNALTWVLAGWLVSAFGWRMAFWLPAGLMLALALGWAWAVRDTPEAAGLAVPEGSGAAAAGRSRPPNPGLLLQRFWPLALAAVFGGFLLFALVVWTPTLLVDVFALGVGAASNVAALLPLAGIAGTLGSGWLVARRLAGREAGFGALVFLALAGLSLAFPLASGSLFGSVALLMLVGAAVYGTASLLLSTLPLVLAARGEAAGAAALIDFAFNLGAVLGGFVVGAVLDRFSWSAVFLVLALAAVLAGLALAGFGSWKRREG